MWLGKHKERHQQSARQQRRWTDGDAHLLVSLPEHGDKQVNKQNVGDQQINNQQDNHQPVTVAVSARLLAVLN